MNGNHESLNVLYTFLNLNFISGIIGVIIGSYIAHKFMLRRDSAKETRDRSLEIFKLSSELLREISLFLASQKALCENYEEYKERSYYDEEFEPPNFANLLNLKNKTFSQFFDISWLNIFYQFSILAEISYPNLKNKLNILKRLVEEIYITREISGLKDDYMEFYNFIEKIKNQLLDLHEEIKSKAILLTA